MNQKEEHNLLNLKFIPQVSLFTGTKFFFNLAVDIFLKRIVCKKQISFLEICLDDDLCVNCKKIKDNYYFDLNWYQFSKNNVLKKQDVTSIIDSLLHQSIENNNPRICIIEGINFASLEANSVFLKFLENMPFNTFLIFYAKNINKVLATIKSRCHIFCSNVDSSIFDFDKEEFSKIKEMVDKFIILDNEKKFYDNFFLIKDLIALKDKLILFFEVLLLVSENQFVSIFKNNSENLLLNFAFQNWKNNNQVFLNNLIENIILVINKFNETKNINVNLLLNNFFINIYFD